MIYPKVQTGVHDAIVNGQFLQNIGDRTCYILSEADLQSIPDDYPVGSLAIRYDATQTFIKVPSGFWQELTAE